MTEAMAQKGMAERVFGLVSPLGPVRAGLFHLYDRMKRRKLPWLAFDRALGIDTRGFLSRHVLSSGKASDSQILAYVGVMPTVVRAGLAEIPDLEASHFIDIGAGKGRALAVASEQRFPSLTGIELNPGLCAIARRHARLIARAHPERTPIRIVEGDASRPTWPVDGALTVFAYHPFHEECMARLADAMAEAAQARTVFFIYVNPVHGGIIDAHPAFRRWYAAQVRYSDDETQVTAEREDALVIWRAGPGIGREGPLSGRGAERPIVVVDPGWGARLGQGADA